ncbi:MAG: hypothetical protein ABI432_12570 [Flavobacteriales bacterium]
MRPLLLSSFILSISANAQYLVNNFDGNNGWPELPIVIDTAASNLWQIGPPQKTVFQSAHSPVKVIVTDTVQPYPAGNVSQFTVLLPTDQWSPWPEFFLDFQQKLDMDSAHAGAYIEISYDTAATWMNVFEDWVNPPVVQFYDETGDPVTPVQLSNGQTGFTGSLGSEWIWSSFCWVQSGIPLPDTVRMRFTFYSDSLALPGDGWMLDDFEYVVYIAHPISEYIKKEGFFVIAPNPMSDRLYIAYDVEDASTPVRIDVIDLQGRLVRNLVDEQQQAGDHKRVLWRNELPPPGGVYLLRASIGARKHVERFEVLGR